MNWDDDAAGWDEHEGARTYSRCVFECLTRVAQSRLVSLGGARILDFGCGTGLLTEKLSPICGDIVAVDTSVRMIERLREKCERLRLTNVQTTTAKIEDVAQQAPALVAGGFDFVVCSSVCAFVDDYPGTVATLVGLLNSGGIFAQWDWELDANADSSHGLTREQVMEALATCRLQAIEVKTAFEFSIAGETMRPLLGVGRKGA